MRTAENFYNPNLNPNLTVEQKQIQVYGIPQHMLKSIEKLKISTSKPAGMYSSSIKNHQGSHYIIGNNAGLGVMSQASGYFNRTVMSAHS